MKEVPNGGNYVVPLHILWVKALSLKIDRALFNISLCRIIELEGVTPFGYYHCQCTYGFGLDQNGHLM